MLKGNKILKLVVGSFVSLTFVYVGAVAGYLIMESSAEMTNKKGEDRFIKTIFNQDAKLETNGEEILVNLYDFTEEEKYYVKQSIREIDFLSDNLNYVFSDEQSIDTNQVMNIYNNCELESTTVGEFEVNIDQFSANMQYPLNIKLSSGLINYYDEFDHDVKLISAVVTHEVMHTLGFNDLRTDNWLGQSIMYWNIDDSSDYGVNKLTESDKQAIINKYPSNSEEQERE